MSAKPYTIAPANTPCGWQNRGSFSGISYDCGSGRDAVHILTQSLPVAPEGTALCAYHSPFDVVPGETASVKFRQCPFCGDPLVAGHSHFGRVVIGAGETVPVETAPVETARGPWSPGSYTVIFRNGAGRICQTTCAIIPGYSTVADIPKMITIKYGDACEVLATMAMGMDTATLTAVLGALAK